MPRMGKGEMTPCAIDRDPHEFGAQAAKLRQDLIEERRLIAADGTPIGGIERKDHGAPAEISERHSLVQHGV
jgi:hypothetical protein